MGGSATVAVVPNRGTAKARLPVRFKYIIHVIWLSDILNSVVILLDFLREISCHYYWTLKTDCRVDLLPPVSPNWWVYVLSCLSLNTAKRPHSTNI